VSPLFLITLDNRQMLLSVLCKTTQHILLLFSRLPKVERGKDEELTQKMLEEIRTSNNCCLLVREGKQAEGKHIFLELSFLSWVRRITNYG
jgi:hypothetical protein